MLKEQLGIEQQSDPSPSKSRSTLELPMVSKSSAKDDLPCPETETPPDGYPQLLASSS
jgi:hypothetical protein